VKLRRSAILFETEVIAVMKNISSFACTGLLAICSFFNEGLAQAGKELKVIETTLTYLTHQLVPAGPIPTALDPNGVYPYISYAETSQRPQPKSYRIVILENDMIRVSICPDLGGKITSIVHKPSGKEVLYVPEVIRPVRILPRFYFVAGGIEVSFPISHSPSQNEKLLYRVDETGGRIYVSCGERELRFGMQWTVEYSLGLRDNFLTERVVFHNPGKQAYPWMSWSNAAVPVSAETEYHFPSGSVLSHSSVIDTIDWKENGPKKESDINEMTGYFWKTRDTNNFGVYTPSLGTGLYHTADQKSAPGMKLWSYGTGIDEDWATLSTASKAPYAEIQGGPIGDQSVKLELQPGETRTHTEFWIPTDRPLDIYAIKTPSPSLRRISEVPVFEWARPDDVRIWQDLETSFIRKKLPPAPPLPEQMQWAPSGLEGLAKSFEWAIRSTDPTTANLWRFYYGAWLAGRGGIEEATRILSESPLGVSKALLARLYRSKGNNAEALDQILGIEEPWLQLHPQVFIERDKLLRSTGAQAVTEREKWFKRVEALRDEWILERKVQLLIDQNKMQEAERLLLSIPFQKVHQTYSRTNLWKQITEKTGRPFLPIPKSLGEDRLATFGAYREFE
jgi:hypothetical protein